MTTARIFTMCALFLITAMLCGCGCYVHGPDGWEDGGGEMASLMEEKPSGVVPSGVSSPIGGGAVPMTVEYVPTPPSFIDRLFVFIDDPDEETFDDMFTGPWGFICEFGLLPPEITSPTHDETVGSDTPTISWTDAEGGYAPYSYWIMCDDDPFFGSPEVDEYLGDDNYYTIPAGIYGCGDTVYLMLICFDSDDAPAYGEIIMFHYPACGDGDSTGGGIGSGIIGDGGLVDDGIVRVVDVGHWMSEIATVRIPFSEMFTGITGDDGRPVGAWFSFAVPRYVIALKVFILLWLILLLGRKKKKKNGVTKL